MEKLSNQINDQRKKNIRIEGNSKTYYIAIEFPLLFNLLLFHYTDTLMKIYKVGLTVTVYKMIVMVS